MEFIHICGESGVGKNFLRQKIENQEPAILQRFKITGEFKFYGPADMEIYSDVRESILSATEPFVIHHWQWAGNEIFDEISQKYPNASQRIILVCRNPMDHLIAVINRDRIRPSDMRLHYSEWSVAFIERRWKEEVLPRLQRAGVPIEIVDGGSEDYREIKEFSDVYPHIKFSK